MFPDYTDRELKISKLLFIAGLVIAMIIMFTGIGHTLGVSGTNKEWYNYIDELKNGELKIDGYDVISNDEYRDLLKYKFILINEFSEDIPCDYNYPTSGIECTAFVVHKSDGGTILIT